MKFPEIRGRLGFGFMRLPTIQGIIDYNELFQMVDSFIESGNNYFDTAHGYVRGQSEEAIKKAIVERYDRSSFVISNKLTENFFNSESDIRPLFISQLNACGTDYFDFYLFHALTKEYYKKFTDCNAFSVIKELKEAGKIHHIGMSFHDSPDILDIILKEHPEIEVVQIQFNYLDYDNPAIQSSENYKIAKKYGKAVFVMEPIKGGSLLKIPSGAESYLKEKDPDYLASLALRFVANYPDIDVILSGMNNVQMIRNNTHCLNTFIPLSENELVLVNKIRDLINEKKTIQCTACYYCVDGCPANIHIPELIAAYNSKVLFKGWNSSLYYNSLVSKGGHPSDCIRCGKCEKKCPQHLKIRNILVNIAQSFEKKKKK